MNIREFAGLCGVSPATVSRILNYSQKESHANAATYAMVREKAAAVGFRPNYAAKSLHGQRRNCIGVIIGFPTAMNCLAIIRGITDCAYKNGFSVSVAACENDPRQERKAFQEMLYRRVDAILWHPVFRRSSRCKGSIERMLQDVTARIPVVCMNSNDFTGVFKFMPNREEDGARAALRQLESGCRKFVVIRSAFSYPGHEVSSDAYVTTLRAQGVAVANIGELVLDTPGKQPDWHILDGVEGVWIYYTFMLYDILPLLRTSCDLKMLHIDGQSFVEDYAMTTWLYTKSNGKAFEELFGSLHYHLLDGTYMARRATEIAIQAINDPTLEPFVERIQWKTPPHDFDPYAILFQGEDIAKVGLGEEGCSQNNHSHRVRNPLPQH